jgi:hypothetical protein
VVTFNHFASSVEEEKGSGSERALSLALDETLVTYQSALLIANKCTNGDTLHGTGENRAVNFGCRDEPWQNRLSEAKEVEKRRLPFKAANIEEKGSRGIGDFADVNALLNAT